MPTAPRQPQLGPLPILCQSLSGRQSAGSSRRLSIWRSHVLLSSLAARAAVDTLSAYAATKGAIDTLVKHFAFVLGGRGVRVVAPGVVQTDMSSFTKTDAGRNYTLGMQALKR